MADRDELVRELDRLRAKLAETRAAGDALAFAVAPIERMGRGAPGSRLDVLITRAEEWLSVRGDAPAPAEPPAASGPRAWSRLPGEIPAGSEQWRDGWATGYEQAGIDASVVDHVRATAAEPPAVELPVTLSSVDDVAAVCERAGLGAVDMDSGKPTWAGDKGVDVVMIGDGPSAQVWTAESSLGPVRVPLGWPSSLLVAAIEAARGGSR